MYNDELYHYGVPGMRWEKRKVTSKIDKISEKAKKRGWSEEATEVAKIKTKKVSQMSNNELARVNNRKQLEQNYSRLNPNIVKKGLAVAGTTVAAMGTLTALYKYSKPIMATGKKVASRVVGRIK